MSNDKVKILLFLSDTKSTLQNQDNEYKDLDAIIASSNYRDSIEFKHIHSTNYDDILDNLNREKPHIVHFSGHGSKDGTLEIHDRSGHYDDQISGEILRETFGTIKSIRFVFFNTCYSKIFGEVVARDIESVLVMNDEIGNDTAKYISERFYKSFLTNLTIAESFGQMKSALASNTREKEIPELLGANNDITIESITTTPSADADFVKEVFERLRADQIILLLSQEFTDTTNYIREIIDIAKDKSDMGFYHFDIPSKNASESRFVQNLTRSLKIHQETGREIDNFDESKQAIKEKLEKLDKSHENLLLFITNFERGNISYTKELAYIIRDLKMQRNFFAIIVGSSRLASMRYQNGELSPLNTAKEIFFPISKVDDRTKIYLAFSNIHNRYKEQICRYLNGKSLGRFEPWSSLEVLNLLFWKNLTINRDGDFVWKNKNIQEIGREHFRCTE